MEAHILQRKQGGLAHLMNLTPPTVDNTSFANDSGQQGAIMLIEYHIHKCTSQSIMLCTSTLLDPLTKTF